MKVVLRHILLALLCAGAVRAGELGRCRLNGDVPASATPWLFDGRGGLSASSDHQTVGSVRWTCRITLKAPSEYVTLSHDHVLINFGDGKDRTEGAGLRLKLEADGASVERLYLRVAGENWIGIYPHESTLRTSRPVRRVTLTLTLVDNSANVPVRVDITNLRVTPGRAVAVQQLRP